MQHLMNVINKVITKVIGLPSPLANISKVDTLSGETVTVYSKKFGPREVSANIIPISNK